MSMTWSDLVFLFLKVTINSPSSALRGLPRSPFLTPVSHCAVYYEAPLVSFSLADGRSHLRAVHWAAVNSPPAPAYFEVLSSQMQLVPLYIHAVTH